MKCKYKSWLAALAATGILAVGAVGMAEAEVTVSSDTVTMSTEDAAALNALIGKQSDLTALAAKNSELTELATKKSELTELSGKKTELMRAADSAFIYGDNGEIQVTKDGTTLDTGWVIDRVTGSNASVVGGDTSIHTKTGVAANDWSLMQKIVNGGHQPTNINGTNNLSLGSYTNAGYGLVSTVKQKKKNDGTYVDETYEDKKTKMLEFSQEGSRFGKYYKYDPNEQYNYTTALGVGTAAANHYATAWGYWSIAAGQASTAWGFKTRALGIYSTAFGEETEAVGEDSLAAGYQTSAVGRYSIALGYTSTATGYRAIVMGTVSSRATGDDAIAIGEQTKALADNSIAIGGGTTDSNKLTKKDNEELYNAKYSVAIGRSATTYGKWASAFGYYSKARGEASTALGGGTTQDAAKYSTALGWRANTKIEYGVALGAWAVADRDKYSVQYADQDANTLIYGYKNKETGDDEEYVWKATSAALSLGGKQDRTDGAGYKTPEKFVTRQITGVAAGTELTDAVNVAQLKAVEKSLKDSVSGAGAVIHSGIGDGDLVDTNSKGVTTPGGKTAGKNNVVLGKGAEVSSWGEGNAVAVGADAFATDTGTALGHAAKAKGGSAVALGNYAETNAEWAIAVGQMAKATGKHSIAFGAYSSAGAENSVALGANSVADRANTVSVGKEGAERQITNVKAGTADTDAVNVSQLKEVKDSVSGLSGKVDGIDKKVTENSEKIAANTKAIEENKSNIEKNSQAIEQLKTAGTATNEQVEKNKAAIEQEVKDRTDADTALRDSIKANTELIQGTDGKFELDNGAATVEEGINTNTAAIQQNSNAIAQNAVNINKLGNRIDRVGAGAAALAALHPLDFDPEAKWDFAAGYGNYRGANAAAVGAFYRPNENWMLSLGGSFGGGENMVNAGVSVKLGAGSAQTGTSKAAMAKEIKELRGTVAAQDARLAAQDERLAAQDEKIAQLTALLNSFVGEGKTPEAK